MEFFFTYIWPLLGGCLLVALMALGVHMVFRYMLKERGDVLDNKGFADYDRYVKVIAWLMVGIIPISAVTIPFTAIHWGLAYKIYLLSLIPYSIIAVTLGHKTYRKLQGHIRLLRSGNLMPITMTFAMLWPILFFMWNKLGDRVAEYERIKHIQSGGKR